MVIRYKHWAVDGVPAHKAIRGSVEYVFLDTEQGMCDVRDLEGVKFLLSRPSNYELAYEAYGCSFGADGKQVDHVPAMPAAVVESAPVAKSQRKTR